MKRNKKKIIELQREIRSRLGDLKLIQHYTEEYFNKYVLVAFQPFLLENQLIGRLVQVRKEVGAFGSDRFFLREFDGTLMCHENQSLYLIPDEFKERLDKLFCEYDEPSIGYFLQSMGHEDKKTGFIIPSEIKESETTPMREVKKRLIKSLREKLD